METLYKLTPNDLVNVYADTLSGKRGYKVVVDVAPKMVDGMWDSLIHYKTFQDERCANKLAATIKTIGQIDLANYAWNQSPAFHEAPTATPIYKKAY